MAMMMRMFFNSAALIRDYTSSEATYVDEFSNDDDNSDSEGDVGKGETAPFRMLSCDR